MKDQELLDLASKASGRVIEDHKEAIDILLAVSREVETVKKALGIQDISLMAMKIQELNETHKQLQKQLDELKSK